MTIIQLQYALALQKHGSFKKAADKLSISQPGLSLQIQKLEQEVGLTLFNRSVTPIQPTTDGELFLLRAKEVVTGVTRLSQFAEGLSEDYRGVIRMGIIPTLAPFLVPLFADPLQRDFPDFQLDIHEMITERVVQGVRNGELDAGIISTPIHVYGIKSIPVFYEKFYFYTSQSDQHSTQIQPEEINYSQLWLLEEGNCFRDQINNFCDLKKIRENKQFVYRSNSIDALIRIVETKGGMTILPELTTLSLRADQEENIRELAGRPKAREISLIVTPTYDKVRFLEKIQEYIQGNIPKSMLDSSGLDIVDPGIVMT